MEPFTSHLLLYTLSGVLASFGILGTYLGVKNSWKNKNPFGLARPWFFLGAFVWGDLVLIGPWWLFVGLVSLVIKSWFFMSLLCLSFWLVRAWGEVHYWLNEQFVQQKRNKPEDLLGYKLFGSSQAIYFGYQLFWQIMLMILLAAVIILVMAQMS